MDFQFLGTGLVQSRNALSYSISVHTRSCTTLFWANGLEIRFSVILIRFNLFSLCFNGEVAQSRDL